MLVLLQLGRWELRLERTPVETGDDQPPVDTPTPMEAWTPEHVGFYQMPSLDDCPDEDSSWP